MTAGLLRRGFPGRSVASAPFWRSTARTEKTEPNGSPGTTRFRLTKRPDRSGSLLVELMVMLPVFATLLVLAIGWIHQSLELASTLQTRQRYQRQLFALARQFREDVHRGRDARFENEQTLVIAFDDATEATYEISERHLVRRSQTAAAGDQPGQPAIRLEHYELPVGDRARWDRSGLPDSVAVVIERPQARFGNSEPASSRAERTGSVADLHVRAALGRHQRLRQMVGGPTESTSESPEEEN